MKAEREPQLFVYIFLFDFLLVSILWLEDFVVCPSSLGASWNELFDFDWKLEY